MHSNLLRISVENRLKKIRDENNDGDNDYLISIASSHIPTNQQIFKHIMPYNYIMGKYFSYFVHQKKLNTYYMLGSILNINNKTIRQNYKSDRYKNTHTCFVDVICMPLMINFWHMTVKCHILTRWIQCNNFIIDGGNMC